MLVSSECFIAVYMASWYNKNAADFYKLNTITGEIKIKGEKHVEMPEMRTNIQK
jgi:hypothetical protein